MAKDHLISPYCGSKEYYKMILRDFLSFGQIDVEIFPRSVANESLLQFLASHKFGNSRILRLNCLNASHKLSSLSPYENSVPVG